MKYGWICVLAFTAMPAAGLFGESQFQVTTLPNIPGGAFTSAFAVSSAGTVGESFTGDMNDVSQPVEWQGAQASVLPMLAGFQGRALAVSASGDVAGYVWNNDVSVSQPVVWHNGQLQSLDTLGMPGGNANAVNNSGSVAGSINDCRKAKRSFGLPARRTCLEVFRTRKHGRLH